MLQLPSHAIYFALLFCPAIVKYFILFHTDSRANLFGHVQLRRRYFCMLLLVILDPHEAVAHIRCRGLAAMEVILLLEAMAYVLSNSPSLLLWRSSQ